MARLADADDDAVVCAVRRVAAWKALRARRAADIVGEWMSGKYEGFTCVGIFYDGSDRILFEADVISFYEFITVN